MASGILSSIQAFFSQHRVAASVILGIGGSIVSYLTANPNIAFSGVLVGAINLVDNYVLSGTSAKVPVGSTTAPVSAPVAGSTPTSATSARQQAVSYNFIVASSGDGKVVASYTTPFVAQNGNTIQVSVNGLTPNGNYYLQQAQGPSGTTGGLQLLGGTASSTGTASVTLTYEDSNAVLSALADAIQNTEGQTLFIAAYDYKSTTYTQAVAVALSA